MYLTNIRLDICFVVNTLNEYMVEPRHVHVFVAKHVMSYLMGTLDCGLTYAADSEFRLWATLIQIGKEVLKTKRALQDVVLVWDQA